MAQQVQDLTLLDCTFRDGGYYNAWNFSSSLIEEYLLAMNAARVNVVELGFRFLQNRGFKGPCAYTTDEFLFGISIPSGLIVAVMVDAFDLCTEIGCSSALERLFPAPAGQSPVDLVRIACHFHQLPKALPGAGWLVERGYRVGISLMQIADCSREDVAELTRMARDWPIEVLYFADSMGSMSPSDAAKITGWMREGWDGSLGIHTHNNMGMALANTLRAAKAGANWLDATVTGMGRGAGNACTEELVIEAEHLRGQKVNMVPLMALIRRHFTPMKARYGWGTNAYYYLAGKHGIHPTFIQEMHGDPRYDDEDILAVIDYLRAQGGKKFSIDILDSARNFYHGEPRGSWRPADAMTNREVLILGSGEGVSVHRAALEAYIRRSQPLVIALNTQAGIDQALIDQRIACHPVRLLADVETHLRLPQPLITPASMLPKALLAQLRGKKLLNFGIGVEPGRFEFHNSHCIVPASLVLAYALAVATSGQAKLIMLAGFDGYSLGDARNNEIEEMLKDFASFDASAPLIAITPTSYKCVQSKSLYGL